MFCDLGQKIHLKHVNSLLMIQKFFMNVFSKTCKKMCVYCRQTFGEHVFQALISLLNFKGFLEWCVTNRNRPTSLVLRDEWSCHAVRTLDVNCLQRRQPNSTHPREIKGSNKVLLKINSSITKEHDWAEQRPEKIHGLPLHHTQTEKHHGTVNIYFSLFGFSLWREVDDVIDSLKKNDIHKKEAARGAVCGVCLIFSCTDPGLTFPFNANNLHQ